MEPGTREVVTVLQQRFDALDADTPEAELDDLWDRIRGLFAGLGEDLPPLPRAQVQLLFELVERDLNARQREFVRRQV